MSSISYIYYNSGPCDSNKIGLFNRIVCPTVKEISRGGAAEKQTTKTQRRHKDHKDHKDKISFIFIPAILKFAGRRNRGNSVEKYYFSEISSIDQANFNWALIFWLLFHQGKSSTPVEDPGSREGKTFWSSAITSGIKRLCKNTASR